MNEKGWHDWVEFSECFTLKLTYCPEELPAEQVQAKGGSNCRGLGKEEKPDKIWSWQASENLVLIYEWEQTSQLIICVTKDGNLEGPHLAPS